MKRGQLTFTDELCKGCNLCPQFCPVDILYLDKDRMNAHGYNLISVTDMDKCIACSQCALICPDSVIKVEVFERE